MNSRGKQIIKVGIIVFIVVLLGMMLTHCTNTTDTKSVKSDKTVEKSKKKANAKKPGKNKSIDVDKSSSQEEKKEEKKEETAKADSPNKSNTSESKKDNTASTTNTGSNKNNTNSSSKPSNSSNSSNSNSSKPAEHKHDWVAQYKTVNVPEKGHNEQVLVQDAYDEQVPVTEMKEICVGNQSGLQINGDPNEYLLNNSNGDSGWHSEWRETVVGYKTVHHDAVYETRYVVDSPATTKQELTGYKCSGCGKTRNN